jgi:hypothetical protein
MCTFVLEHLDALGQGKALLVRGGHGQAFCELRVVHPFLEPHAQILKPFQGQVFQPRLIGEPFSYQQMVDGVPKLMEKTVHVLKRNKVLAILSSLESTGNVGDRLLDQPGPVRAIPCSLGVIRAPTLRPVIPKVKVDLTTPISVQANINRNYMWALPGDSF